MGKYIGPVCRLCRVEGIKLFLKGSRCLSEKCSVSKRNYPPGMKGARASFRRSNYKNQLREKQKVKRFYGVGERQFRNFFAKANQRKGITGENLLRTLELRLDNVLYRMNFTFSRTHAKQLIRHGLITVNGRRVTIPSCVLRINDEISLSEKAKKNENLKAMIESIKGLVEVPGWLLVNPENFTGKINSLPNREDVSLDVEERLIVELYSK